MLTIHQTLRAAECNIDSREVPAWVVLLKLIEVATYTKVNVDINLRRKEMQNLPMELFIRPTGRSGLVLLELGPFIVIGRSTVMEPVGMTSCEITTGSYAVPGDAHIIAFKFVPCL